MYDEPLCVALDAARAAGDILRAEFHRAGGPRGESCHAEADVEAEHDIRRRLLDAFPGWGFTGAETGHVPEDAGDIHCWLVDPNNGTSAYLRGERGSAVSIALLREGVPVLGVVYAFAAPDDRGDLLYWAEGCGPLRRQDHPLDPPPWPQRLSPTDVVMVSADANKRAGLNAAAVRPARFRAVPSVAWRLALTAAGEGVAAVCTRRPRAWEVAAGHALLRGVGGSLVDEHDCPLTYSCQGDLIAFEGTCLGGAPQILRNLARADWTAVRRGRYDEPEQYDLVREKAGDAIRDAEILSRAQGCLLGQIAGDSLGSLVEFKSSREIARLYPDGLRHLADGGVWNTLAGQPTDDSELALMLARTLVAEARYDEERVAGAYATWYRSNPFDVGGTTSRALAAIAVAADGRVPPGAAQTARSQANPQSQANGSLMRISPLGIWAWRLPRQVAATVARQDSALTHPHTVCQDACAACTVAIAHAVRTGQGPEATFAATLEWACEAACDDVVAALRAAREGPPPDFSAQQGWVLVALRNAFYELLAAATLADGVRRTVMRGGDTDTNGAIAGALLGAVHGREALPDQWLRMVLSCHPVRHHAYRPRPRAYWPVDALVLAERLLASGDKAVD